MTAFIELEENIEVLIEYEELFNQALDASLDYLKCPYEVEVSLLITDNKEIHGINLEQRGMDKPTDVLSFPMIEWNEIGDYDTVETQMDCFHPDSGELMLGDIILSYEKVLEQAEEYGHRIEREFSFLVVHSILHLFGHDHMEDEERVLMEQAQSDIMGILGIGR